MYIEDDRFVERLLRDFCHRNISNRHRLSPVWMEISREEEDVYIEVNDGRGRIALLCFKVLNTGFEAAATARVIDVPGHVNDALWNANDGDLQGRLAQLLYRLCARHMLVDPDTWEILIPEVRRAEA